MKTLLYIALGIVIAVTMLLVALSIASRKQPTLGLHNGQLLPCPKTPNCVCSEQATAPGFIEPLVFTTSAEDAWGKVKQELVTMGGNIENDTPRYLHATFQTKLFRFIDDVELRRDANNHVIHVRSASRVGRSDRGLNKIRVEQLRLNFNR